MTIAIRPNSQISYPLLSAGAFTAALAVRETGLADAPKPRFLDRVRETIRASHDSHRTNKAYVHWIKRYIFFHGKRHPAEMGAPEVTAFLTSLAVHDNVAASTQNHVLSALLFLYREVLRVDLPWLDDVVRAKRPQHLPVVLTRHEVRAVLQRLDGVSRLMTLLLYGAGLRLLECCHLRVKDNTHVLNRGPAGVRSPADRMISAAGTHIGPADEAQLISCSASRCTAARDQRRALHVRVNAGADGARPGSFLVLYTTTQPDIAIQDTERWAGGGDADGEQVKYATTTTTTAGSMRP